MLKITAESKGNVTHGVSSCQGCGIELIIRNVLDVLGDDIVLVIPPGCAALFSGTGSEAALKVAGIQGNLENSAAIAAGIAAGFRHQRNEHTIVTAFAGDGATVDIGLQALSGAMERNDNILYICYDNEAYMNTGIQGSGSTPIGAYTTTTPAGKSVNSKDFMQVIMAHHIPYAATASVANLPDLRRKVKKAKNIRGCRVLHIHCPCPTGWGYPSAKSIEVAREGVASGAWILMEYENGKVKLGKAPNDLGNVEKYTRLQKRFRNVTDEQLVDIGTYIRQKYVYLQALEKL